MLPIEHRREIVRRLAKGESIRGIATAIDCNPSTVQRLKKKLEITPTQMHTVPSKKHTPSTKKHTVTMTCEEYAAHKGEVYSVFKHGAGIIREVVIP